MKTLIVANWKMNGGLDWLSKPAEFRKYYPHRDLQNRKGPQIVICPPFHLLAGLAKASAGLDIAIGGQNCHFEKSGAFTGEISANMLTEIGAGFVILGHSERRAMFGEKNKLIAKKVMSAQAAGLSPIVCVGESLEVRDAGQADEFIAKQLRKSLPKKADSANIIIAYEPIWAIGTGLTPSLEDIAAMHDHIRGILGTIYGSGQAQNIPILYGGSVKPANAKGILALADVNGALIGGASLDMDSFAAIARCA